MTQEENWNIRLAEVWEFVKKNQRFPSRHQGAHLAQLAEVQSKTRKSKQT